jgi:Xaa-Pro aminopeptidase
MRYKKINSSLFSSNRDRLIALLPNNAMVVFHSADQMPSNGDQFFPYIQQSDLFYLSGIEQPETILVIIKTNNKALETLFISYPDPEKEIWDGHRLTKKEAIEISEIQEIKYVQEFDAFFGQFMQSFQTIYLNRNENKRYASDVQYKNLRFWNWVEKHYPKIQIVSIAPFMEKLRLIKSNTEIELMKQACNITKQAFYQLIKTIKPGVYEYELEAEISYIFTKNGATHAYEPIVASGKNACVLHYIENNSVCKAVDLILIDFGASYANYAADCTRMFPVSGKFTQRQKELYEATLKIMKAAILMMIPGNTIEKIQKEVCMMWQEEHIKLGLYTKQQADNAPSDKPLYRKYFMHGVSHFLGLDVHDLGEKNIPFEPGMVLTCEPGIYIKEEGIGIRLETNILITPNAPIDLMQDIPIEIKEIEALF